MRKAKAPAGVGQGLNLYKPQSFQKNSTASIIKHLGEAVSPKSQIPKISTPFVLHDISYGPITNLYVAYPIWVIIGYKAFPDFLWPKY
jgi:hypothetical protein